MKIDKILKNDSGILKIVSESIVLEQDNAGRAIFAVQSEDALSGMVYLSLALNKEYKRYLTGYIESSLQVDSKQQRLVVREPAAVLAKRWTISKRNTNAVEILEALNSATGCAFSMGSGNWSSTSIPHFINIGTGYEAIKNLGRELCIDDFTWLSQPNGTIYVGPLSKADIYQNIIGVPADFFFNLSASGADCPIVPGFRPGKRIRIGNGEILTIDSVTVSGTNMRINWL